MDGLTPLETTFPDDTVMVIIIANIYGIVLAREALGLAKMGTTCCESIIIVLTQHVLTVCVMTCYKHSNYMLCKHYK